MVISRSSAHVSAMAIDDYVTKGDDARTDSFEWGSIDWLDGDGLTAGTNLTVGRVTFAPGASNATHFHPNCEEILYVLSGELEHSINDERTTLQPGDLLHIPKGDRHSATNLVDAPTVALIAYDTDDRQIEFAD